MGEGDVPKICESLFNNNDGFIEFFNIFKYVEGYRFIIRYRISENEILKGNTKYFYILTIKDNDLFETKKVYVGEDRYGILVLQDGSVAITTKDKIKILKNL